VYISLTGFTPPDALNFLIESEEMVISHRDKGDGYHRKHSIWETTEREHKYQTSISHSKPSQSVKD
jgi:hypothetical protein